MAKRIDAHVLNPEPRQLIYVYNNTDEPSRKHCFSGKTIIISSSECMSIALVIPHAMRMRRIILPSVSSVAVPFFPHYLLHGAIFMGKITFGH